MANLNMAVLIGRMVADPELKTTPSGVSVTSFSIAVNRRYKQGEEQQADFINVVAWRNTADFITKYFKKGSSIFVRGSIQTRSWTDNDGNKRYVTEIVADDVQFADSKATGASNSNGNSAGEQVPSFSNNVEINPYNGAPQFEEIDDDDIPF